MIKIVSFFLLSVSVDAFSASLSETAQLARSRLQESLKSPSGKLTISPEILIPEPTDPTAILLQSTAVKSLSGMIRTKAKANSAWLSGSPTTIKTFCVEQEDARGNFPGPLPVVYCGGGATPDELLDCGVAGVLVSANGGQELLSVDQLSEDSQFLSACTNALQAGIQPVPEIVIADATAKSWGDDDMLKLFETLQTCLGNQPAAILITINPESDEQQEVSLPSVPKSLTKQLPILGSVRVTAGENRMGPETARFKKAGFTGTIMRSDCVPGFRLNPDLDLVGQFWSACIADLKSTKSKSFEFRTRNYLESNTALEWAKYQKNVLDSGALGEQNMSVGMTDLDADNGDFKGF